MRLESKKHLHDVKQAAEAIFGFLEGKSQGDYLDDGMLRSAVERQFEIIGEAMNRLAKSDPETATRFASLSRIVSFRNILIHGYDVVDHYIVWDLAQGRLRDLHAQIETLLSDS